MIDYKMTDQTKRNRLKRHQTICDGKINGRTLGAGKMGIVLLLCLLSAASFIGVGAETVAAVNVGPVAAIGEPVAVNADGTEDPIRIFLDGKELAFEVAPVEIDGRTLVPMRPIFEALQADISWDHQKQTVTALKDGKEMVIVRDSYVAWVNGEAHHLDVSARTLHDRMMVPVRFISEALDVTVQWTELERRVDLFTEADRERGEDGETGQGEAGELPGAVDGKGSASNDNVAYPKRMTGEKPISGKLAFGTQAPRGISFPSHDFFVDTQSPIFYQIVIEFDEKWQKSFAQADQQNEFPLEIHTYLWGPEEALLLERQEVQAKIRKDAKEYRTHNSVKVSDLSGGRNTNSGKTENDKIGQASDNSWSKGVYRMAVEINGELVFVEDFTIVESINTMGNTSGNLLNHGLVARQGDFIYYVGPDGGLYKKTIQGKDVVKLTSDEAEYLNTQGQWIYFVNRSKDGVISRIRYDGKLDASEERPYYYYSNRGETETLSHDASGQMLLVNDWIYYINLSDKRKLYRMKTDGSDQELVIDQPLQQFYVHDRQIVYMTFEEKFSDWSDTGNKKKRDERIRGIEEDYQLAVGYLYILDLDDGTAKKMAEDPVISMAVANQSVYCLTPKRGASWTAQISGRVPGNLYRLDIPHSTEDLKMVSLPDEEVLAEEVMNFYVDSDWLLLQTNPNRGNVIGKYTVDGDFVDELETKIGRKRHESFNRTTFPVTFINGAYEWIYYYAGDESERVTDSMPLRNDRYRSIKENSLRELQVVEDDYYW